MTITISKPTHGTGQLPPESEALASIMANALLQQHAAQPFANSLQVSEWLHHQYPNPRVRVETAENGSPVKVLQRSNGVVLLSIACHPTH